jgi:DEAD/DEAH box helicase domain-containing protein
MRERGIGDLYRHQAHALDLLREGRNVVVATGTASGKSLCYQIPIVEAAVEGAPDTALLLFPTKALAHDQLRSLHTWLIPELEAAAYDGDTPNEERTRVRKRARVVVTNPDMLHVGILPNHQRWATFFTRLQYVVVDELHTLRGIFGSHVAHLLRRLRRVCAYYGSAPTFCFASATIGNPGPLAAELCGLPVETIDRDGSPRAERCFAVWERPLIDPEAGTRLSANVETARIVSALTRQMLHSIAFTRSRKAAELVAQNVRDQLSRDAPELVDRVAAYRGGYLPSERRNLEEQLSSGDLLAVAATNALELGIDIGMLDAITLNGFPGTLASMWQQAGRAGRAGQRALAVLVAGDDQLDQYYATHPTELFTRELEPAVVNPRNPFVVKPHLSCAAFEIPLADKDAEYFGDDIDDHVGDLVRENLLRPRGRLLYWAGRRPPAREVSLRTGASVEYQLLESGSLDLIGTVDSTRVFQVAHEGAIYLHQGRQYRVAELDTRRHHAVLEPNDDEEYTQTREDIDLSVTGVDVTAPLGRATAHLGSVSVQTDITAYQRKAVGTGEVIEVVDLDLPPRTLDTRASWYTVPHAVVDELGLETARLLGALHAAEHAMIGMLPMFTICDRWDVGGLSIAVHPDTHLPTIFIYDGYPGGAGIAELAHACAARHVQATLELVRACPCESGCPSCVQSPKCGNWNEYLDKEAAVALLEALQVGG